jgi:hypothetical protein
VKLKIKNIILTIKDAWNYVFPIKKLLNTFKTINSPEQLQSFIQERSAHVTQTTLYGYLKTRIGTRYAMMFEDETFLESINIAKWNIYVISLADCTLFTISYLICEKNLKENEAEKIFFSMLENEKKNGLSEKLINESILDFKQRVKETKWLDHYKQNPFKKSGSALYKWAPIADDLKVLDKEIVLNSIMLKWNLVENEFKELTKNLNFK